MPAFAVPAALRTTEARIFISVLVILAFFLNPIPYSKAKGHIKSTQVWVRTGSFVVPEVPAEVLERTKDSDLSDYYGEYGERDGQIYPKYPPGTNVLLAPLDVIARHMSFVAGPIRTMLPDEEPEVVIVNCLGTIVWTACSVAVVGILIWWSTSHVTSSERLRLATVALTVFGTILFYHGTGLYTKPVSCALTFTPFLMLWHLRLSSAHARVIAPIAGFLLGFGVSVDYQVGITLVLISAYVVWTLPWRQTILFCTGVAIPLVCLLAFHWVVIGHPLATTYSLAYGHRESAGMGLPHPAAIFGLTIGPERGIIWYMPALLFGICGLFYGWQKRDVRAEVVLCSLVVAGHLAFNFCANDWRSGAGFGPRYLIPAIPFAMLWAPLTLARWPRLVTVPIGVASVCVSYLGAQAYFIPIQAPSQLWAAAQTFYATGGSATRVWRWVLRPGWTAATGVEDPGFALVLVGHLLTLGLIAAGLYLLWRKWPGWRHGAALPADA